MGALLHFFPADEARDLVAGYAAALAPGSYVVLSVGRADGDAEAKGFGTYSSTGAAEAYNHSAPEFAGFFGPLSLVPPGVADAPRMAPGRRAADPAAAPPRPVARRRRARGVKANSNSSHRTDRGLRGSAITDRGSWARRDRGSWAAAAGPRPA